MKEKKELDNKFINKINKIEEEDYIRYNNFRHETIRRTRPKLPIKKESIKKEDNKTEHKNDLNNKVKEDENENEKDNLTFNSLSKIETFFLTLLFRKINVFVKIKWCFRFYLFI